MKKLLYTVCLLLTGWQLQAQINTIKDIYPGSNGSQPTEFTSYKGFTYFAATSPIYGRELWKTDGTTAGTFLVKDVYQGVLSSNPKDLFVANNILYFTANNGVYGNELWMTDGTITKLAKDFVVGSGSSDAKVVANFNGKVLVNYNTATENKTETLDGSATISVITGTTADEIEPSHFYKANNGLLYYAGANNSNDVELYSWDGSTTPQLVANINASGSSVPEYFLQWNDSLFFQANDGIHGREMCKTALTTGGTTLWADMVAGSGSSGATPLIVFNNKLVWQVDSFNMASGPFPVFDTPRSGQTLFLMYDFLTHKIDTTKKDYEFELKQFNGKLFYAGYKTNTGQELYSWDGTNLPTLALDYNTGTASSNPSDLFVYKDHLFFNATDATGKTNLVMYNGNTWGNVKDSSSSLSYHDTESNFLWSGEDLSIVNGGLGSSKVVIGTTKDTSGNEEVGVFNQLSVANRNKYNYDKREVLDYWMVVVQGSTDSLNVVTAWNSNSNNTFTAQLSNKDGSFTNPTNIGTMSSSKGGKMAVHYPTNLPQSENYRVRIVASSPADTSLPSNEKIALIPTSFINSCNTINPNIDSIYGGYAVTYTYWQIDSLGLPVSSFAPITVDDTLRFAPDATNPEMMTIKSLNTTSGIFNISQPKYNIDATALKVGKKVPAINNNATYAHISTSPTTGLPFAPPPYVVTPLDLNPFGFSFLSSGISNMVSGPIQLPGRGHLIIEPKRNIGTYAGNRYELNMNRSFRTINSQGEPCCR